MKFFTICLAVISMILIGYPVQADPNSSNTWTQESNTGVYTYTFTGTGNSALLLLGRGPWTLRFNATDDSDGDGAGEIQFRCQVGTSATTNRSVAIKKPNGSSTLADGDQLFGIPAGSCWVEVTTSSGVDLATVTLQPNN